MSSFQKRFLLISVSLLLNGFLLFFARKLEFDNSHWLDQDNPHEQKRKYIDDEYEKGESCIVAVNLEKDFFNKELIETLSRITEEIEQIPYVTQVKNPLTATTIINHNSILKVLSFQEALNQKIIPDIAEYKERFKKSDYYGNLISKDYQKVTFQIKVQKDEKSIDNKNFAIRAKTIELVQKIFHTHIPNVKYHFAGELYLNYSSARLIQEDIINLLPITLILSCIFLYMIFRSFTRVFSVLYIMIGILGFMSTLFVVHDYPISAASSALPIMLVVIAIADAIHIFRRWDANIKKISDLKEAAKRTFQETWLPCFLTSLTTAVGFGSFYFSELIPLRHFGKISFISILSAYAMIISHIWLSLLLFYKHYAHKSAKYNKMHTWLNDFLRSLYKSTSNHSSLIVTITFVFIAIGISSLSLIRTESNLLDTFFKKKSKVYQNFNFVDEHLGGTGGIDIILQAHKETDFKEVKVLKEIEHYESLFREDKSIHSVQSYLNPIRMIHKEFSGPKVNSSSLPQNNSQLSQEILFLEFSRGDSENDVLSPYVDFNYKNSRVHLRTPNLNSSEATKMQTYLENTLQFKENFNYFLAGSSIYFNAIGEYVVETQFISITLTLICIWILFVFQFGFKNSLIGLIANLFPVLATVSIIVYLRIPFDIGTVLISSISFGLCVDDTIHFLHSYHIQKSRNSDFHSIIQSTLRMVGQPIFFTSVLFGLSFLVFTCAQMIILIKLGIFTFISLSFAFFSNIIILPALLQTFDSKASKPKGHEKSDR